MDKLRILAQKAQELAEEMKQLETKAAAEENEAKKAEILNAFKAKEQEAEELKAKMQAAREDIEAKEKSAKAREALLAEAKKLNEVVVPRGATLVPAEPKDHEKDHEAKILALYDFMNGKDISQVMYEAMRPKSDSWGSGKAVLALPERLAVRVMGKAYAEAFGKALPMSAGDALRSALVPQDYRAQLLELAAEAPSILQRCTIVPSTTGTVTWPRLVQTDSNEYGGVTGSWIDEGAEKPETEGEFEQVNISCHEYAAYTEVTHKLIIRSAIAIEGLLTRLFKGAVQNAMDTAFLTGSGTGQPLGIVNTAGIRTVARAAAGAVGYADLVNLEHAVQAYHRAGSAWIAHDGVIKALKLLVDTQNRPLFVPAIAGGIPDRLIGYVHIDTYRLPTLGNDGDVIFGDIREYIVAMEEDVVVKRSEHYRFRHNRVAYTVCVNVGGELVQPRAMAILSAGTS